jgi:endo-1,4-beta-xylanase
MIKKIIICSIVGITIMAGAKAQDRNPDESIAKIRKGNLIVHAKKGDKVMVEQLSHEFWFGCAIPNSLAGAGMNDNDREMFKKKFLENFNSAVTENAVKWPNMEPRKGEVNYAIVDGILKWTDENNIPLRGHNIFWGITKFIQLWVKELDENELRSTLENRAESLTSHYKGRFAEYDLNNEMLHGNYYAEKLGEGITKQMAEWAHAGDPDAKLFLNDYDVLTGNYLSAYMAQIRTLRHEGVPIAGIGAQGHLHAESFDRKALTSALDSLATFGLPIRITEFNLPGQRSKYYENRSLKMTPEEEAAKAKDIVDYYRICFAHQGVDGILMWGFWEGANWIPQSSLYRRDWTPTPAAEAYHNLIYKEWWTKESGVAGKDGNFSVRAFFGKYKITVNGKSKEVALLKKTGKITVEFTE